MSGFAHDGSGIELVFSKNVDFSGGTVPTGQILTNSQMLIGTTAVNAGGTHINVGTITSTTLTIGYSSPNITINTPGGAAVTSVTTSNATAQFVLTGSTENINFGITNLCFGSSYSLISGTNNVSLGISSLNSITSGTTNTVLGAFSGESITTGSTNTICGAQSGEGITTGSVNCMFGVNVANSLTTGTDNVILGHSAGASYTSSESSNVLINNFGIVGESNVMRFGRQGSGAGQQNQCYLAGVLNTVSGRVVKVTAPGAYPYLTLITDYVIIVDSSSARTINLVASPVTGTTYRIKDNVGSAAANNITITPAAGTIDGAASFTINANWGSVDVCYNGTSWIAL